MAETLLRMRGITKTFPGVVALERASLEVRPGEIHALIGENGAGKSTLIRILGGVFPRDSGEIVLGDERVEIPSPARSQHLGIRIIHQELSYVGPLSVAENLFLGDLPRRGPWVDWGAMRRRARTLLDEMGMEEIRPEDRVDQLSVAQQQLLEIARAVRADARLVVMDEPTAALTEQETERLFALIRDLRARRVTVVYITHRLGEIFALADRVTVMRDGQTVATLAVAETDADELIRLMVGREITEKFPKAPALIGDVALRVESLSAPGAFRDVSFEVRRGEILGIAGLAGSGKIALGHALFGALPATGRVRIDGREVRLRSPLEGIAAGLGLVPEDRKRLGLVPAMGVRANVTLPALPRLERAGFVLKGAEQAGVEEVARQLRLRAASLDQPVRDLSGGNQQKVVVGRWLHEGSRVLVLCEPTRGVDVGARVELYRILGDLAQQGTAIVLISSDLPEVLGLADRVLVMHEGRITGAFARAEATQERIMASATGREHGSPGAAAP